MNSARLEGYRLLIVEDDYFLATELAAVLAQHGAEVLGPASGLEEGRRLALEGAPHGVLLDINLRGQHAFALAEELTTRGIATIFTTGYDDHVIPARLRDRVFLRKPLDMDALLASIETQLRPAVSP